MNPLIPQLPRGNWDIFSLFTNATNLGEKLAGAFVILVGLVCIICAVVFFAQKLLSEQSRRSWVVIILLLVAGGAMMAGGINLFVEMAKGSKTTIDQLGTGLILFQMFR
ncbi:hypothetical protein [Arthrobacter bambusae]|uniref:Membrane protein n=1 Tax=Arthrobacter bambusae TaxID=1338426 RepID=A0AAW8DBF0_9MICC|nr:hypothetical protein [Arthrobacter bambusae]MDP9903207.1 putative membrane protein [Arthrobacter bambusae]MDQ0128799.1 putative membrane protein [Arthrobacter bambusae]MDQ0180140.1 putative membrane protein [Arthrobacter bambusae]